METNYQEVESTVSAVTVYQGRAMITRHVETELEAGSQTLVFANLPAELNRESIQVKGVGEATLGECIFETEYFSEDIAPKLQPLSNKRRKFEDEIADISLEIQACDKEKSFIEKVAGFVTTPKTHITGNGAGNSTSIEELSASTWNGLLAFYHEKNSEIDKLRLTSERRIRDLEQELETINSEIESLGYDNQRSRNIIKLNLDMSRSGRILLDLSYILDGPTWWPIYDVRATGDQENVTLEYNAVVRQATGEDWKDVDLSLSTAKVNVSGVIPELLPWRLNIHRPRTMASSSQSKMMMVEDEEVDLSGMMGKSRVSESAVMHEVQAPEDFQIDEAEIDNSGASVVFTVAGGGTIGGDNHDTRVSLMKRELPSSFHYSSVPKLVEFAYITALITNNSEFPLLPGKANIFYDGSFVSSSELSLIMPEQDLEISLGIDEAVKVEYRYISRFRKNEGLVNKKVSEQFEYQIRITNNRTKEIEIKVYDQFPISEEKEIVVKRLAPTVKEYQNEITIDDESKLCFQFKLAAGKKRELPLSFLVEYPSGVRLAGL